jgi:hypothetical protein
MDDITVNCCVIMQNAFEIMFHPFLFFILVFLLVYPIGSWNDDVDKVDYLIYLTGTE